MPDSYIEFPAQKVEQGASTFFLFTVSAKRLWSIVSINERQEDKDEGYQRVLSPSRVQRISKYVQTGGSVPGTIMVTFDDARFDEVRGILIVPNKPDAGWVIDGQHRLVGAHHAAEEGADISLACMATIGLSLEKQVELFITINKEAKGVPSSLYIDLLKHLPRQKTEKEIVEERVADIAKALNSDEQSAFYQRIVSTRSPGKGQISLVNFARIMRPLIMRPTGVISLYSPSEQQRIIDNYYSALGLVFKKAFDAGLFYKTVGFGAAWRVFPLVINRSIADYKGFTVQNARDIINYIKDYDVLQWNQMGTGSQAESQAGDDMMAALEEALLQLSPDSGSINL